MSSNTPSYPNRAAALRAKLLSQNVPPNKSVEIEGETYFIRSPVLADKQKLLELAGVVAPTVKAIKGRRAAIEEAESRTPAVDQMLAAAAILLAVDETGNALFTLVDADAIRNAPMGGWLEQLARACLQTITGVTEEEEAEGVSPGEG